MRAIAGDYIGVQNLATRRLPNRLRLERAPLRRHAATAARAIEADEDVIPFESPKPNVESSKFSKQKGTVIGNRGPSRNSRGQNNTRPSPTSHISPSVSQSSPAPSQLDTLPPSEPKEDTKEVVKTRPNAITIENKSALLKELEWLPDRLKLAQHVHYTLRCNDPEKALNLCRLASKNEEVIVSWNHVVDWYMRNGRFDDALKTYNEMKKRGQFPDAHTYTLLLRGLATPREGDHKVSFKNVARATGLYHSLSSSTSRVKPNIYHTNAALKVCAEGNNMDALWGIVSKLPDKGSSAPDRVTYGIIINAIRKSAFGFTAHRDSNISVIPERQLRALSEARAVWRDIIARWRAGEVRFDEQLVVEMAKLLLESPRMQDWDDVFNLIQQTMNIERLISPLGSPDRKIEHLPRPAAAEGEEGREMEEDEDGWKETPSGKAFLPVVPQPQDISGGKYRRFSLAWAQPGNQTLSQVLQACALLRIPKAAGQYWDVLTSHPYNVQPNYANFHVMLRLLRRNRASAKALALVKDVMPTAGQEPTALSYLLAMVTCVRDMKNPNVLDNAKGIVDAMEARCDPITSSHWSVESLVLYLTLSLSTDSAAKITETLYSVHALMDKMKKRAKAQLSERNVERSDTHIIVHLMRTMIGTVQAVLDFKMVSSEAAEIWADRKRVYERYLSRVVRQARATGQSTTGVMVKTRGIGAGGGGGVEEGAGAEEVAGQLAIGKTEPALQAFRRRHSALDGKIRLTAFDSKPVRKRQVVREWRNRVQNVSAAG